MQLFSERVKHLEGTEEEWKKQINGQERKIDELERQCSNEKLLRSTLSKLQADIETKCAETQKIIIEYEKQLKHFRDELANVNILLSSLLSSLFSLLFFQSRRKLRTGEERHSLLVTKVFELLRLTRIVPESLGNDVLPTFKQLEELKVNFEQLRTTKVDQSNELNRLKKALERANRSSLSQKQSEQDIEVSTHNTHTHTDQLSFRSNERNFREKWNNLESPLISWKNK